MEIECHFNSTPTFVERAGQRGKNEAWFWRNGVIHGWITGYTDYPIFWSIE